MGIFAVVRKGFVVSVKALSVLLILFLYNLAINFASRPLQGAQPAAWSPEKWATFAGVILVAILGGIFFQGGMLGFLADTIKQGRSKLSIFVSTGAKFFGRLFGLAAILFAAFGLAAIILAVLFGLVAAFAKDNTAIMTAGAVILLIPAAVAVYYLILLSYSPIILVAGDAKIFESMRRSIDFVRKNILKLIGLALVLFLIAFLAGLLVGILVGLATFAASASVRDFIAVILGSAVNSYFNIVMTAGLIAFYLAISGAVAPEIKAAAAEAPQTGGGQA